MIYPAGKFIQGYLFIWQFDSTLLINVYVSAWFMQLPSSNFFRPSGSARQSAILSNSRDAVVDSETEPSSRPPTQDPSQGAIRKSSGAQRSSHIMSSEHNRVSSGRNTSSNLKNLDSTLRGIESLHLNDERAQY